MNITKQRLVYVIVWLAVVFRVNSVSNAHRKIEQCKAVQPNTITLFIPAL